MNDMSLIRSINPLSKRTLNIMFNLAEYIESDTNINWDEVLTKNHDLTTIYLNLSRGVDMDEDFEYSTISELICRSMTENESLSQSDRIKFLKVLAENKEKYNINVNTDKLITYLL